MTKNRRDYEINEDGSRGDYKAVCGKDDEECELEEMGRIQYRASVAKGSYGFEDAVSFTGFGRFNLYLILVAGGCLMSVIIETQSMMFVIPAAQCDLELSLSAKGILSSVNYLGVFTSSHLWGFLADTKGRRFTLLICLFSSFVVSVLSSIIPQAWLFIVLRYINGFLNGGATAIIYAYAGEFHNNKYRPKVVSWVGTFIAVANIVIPCLAWMILPMSWSFETPLFGMLFRPWRLLVIAFALPSLIFAVMLYMLPESPKFSLSQGRNEEALDVVRNIFLWNGHKKEDFCVTDLVLDEVNPYMDKKEKGLMKSMWDQTVPLFKTPFALKTFMVCLIQFGLFFSMNGVLMWYPEILNGMSVFAEQHPKASIGLCSSVDYLNNKTITPNITEIPEDILCIDTVNTRVYLTGIFVGIAYVFTYFTVGTFINLVGKKNLLIFLLAATAVAGIVAQNVSGHLYIQLLIGAFLMGGSGIGVTNAIVVDLYPTQIRAMALAIGNMAGRLGAVAGTNVTGPIIYQLCSLFFYVFTIDHIILGIITFLLPSVQEPKLHSSLDSA